MRHTYYARYLTDVNRNDLDNMVDSGAIDEEILTADGFDEAIIGLHRGGHSCVVYDEGKVIDILVDRDGMSFEEAVEYYDFNISGAHMGPNTPIFIQTRA